MRSLDENKMVAVEAGDWETVGYCALCIAGAAAAGICVEALLAMIAAGGGEAVVLYGIAVVEACKACYYGITE